MNEDKVIPKNFDIDKDNVSVWYLDNRVSNHMTENKKFFSSLNLNTKGNVNFGDGPCIDFVGKCVVAFVCKIGEKKTLKDIYYIPNLKHNILSLGQATENRCKVNMKTIFVSVWFNVQKITRRQLHVLYEIIDYMSLKYLNYLFEVVLYQILHN